jgi:hypothetical protein
MKPSGAIIPADLGYLISSDEPEYLYYGFRVAQALSGCGWSQTSQRLRMRFRSCVTVGAGSTIYIDYLGSNCREVRAGALARDWSAAWVEVVYNPESTLSGTAIHGVPSLANDTGTNPLTRIKPIKIYADKGNSGTIHQFMVEMYHYDPQADDVEEFDRTDGADVLYQPNAPVSSWMMREAVAGSYNWISQQNRLLLSWPVWKQGMY